MRATPGLPHAQTPWSPREATTRAGMPTAIAPAGNVLAHDRAGADRRRGRRSSTPSRIFAPAPIQTPSPMLTPGRRPRLLEHGLRRIREVVIAADDVAVRRHQHAAADRDAARREHLAVEADVRAVAELDVAVLARQDRVAADEHAVADPDAAVRLALRVEQAVVVDDDVAADVNLVRMAQHDVLAEDDVAAARSEQHRDRAPSAAPARAHRPGPARA